MSSHELYDKILRELPKDGALVGNTYDDIDIGYLAAKGYLKTTSSEGGKIVFYCLTYLGLEFISEGGFAELNKRAAQDDAHKKLERENLIATTRAATGAKTISIISIIIAALSLIVAAIALLK